MAGNLLIGTWRLVSWTQEASDGHITSPFGPDATGFLTYTADGHMAVMITRASRRQFATPDLLAGSVEEKVGAAESYLGYGGTYELRDHSVLHHVTHSLFPNWEGTHQERLMQLEGDRLTLSTRPTLLAGEMQTAHLTWQRAGSATVPPS